MAVRDRQPRLTQHIKTSTHNEGHTLDVVITRSDSLVTEVSVEEPIISDHSFITARIDLQFGRGQWAGAVRRRQWRRFDYDQFCADMKQ